jgi:uncharacterized membrane protein YgcG
MKKLLFTLFAVALIFSHELLAREEILNYHSAIDIQQDGSLQVTESIEVQAENQQIKHGIYRDFPTLYHDRLGNEYRTSFKLLSVKRNGIAEPYFTKKQSNGVRIYIGDKNITLTPGIYQYEISYVTDRQLGFFKDFDELYFNVTGNGWAFPILQASATVSLPAAVDSTQVKLTGYTGVKGSSAQNLRHSITPNSHFYFSTTRPLLPHEGLTLVADWPKGIITEPSAEQKQQQFIDDNRPSLIIGAGVVVVFIYYLLVWLKVGKDPEAGVIYPRYQAPDGYSPASMRFIRNMKYDKSCFTAALLNLAVKGVISIDQNDAGLWVIRQLNNFDVDLAAGEAVILDELFGASNKITLTQSEHKRLGKAIKRHEKSLREDYQKRYFMTNKNYFVPGLLISLGAIIWSITEVEGTETTFATAFIGIFTLIPVFVLLQIKKAMTRKNKSGAIFQGMIQFVFLGFFIFMARDVIESMASSISAVVWPVVIGTIAIVIINILFMNWLKAPTLAGRKLLDQVEGLELYLKVAEDDEIEQAGQPKFNADIYQQFLPFAFALGVDHAWSQRLQRAISAGLVEPNYYPTGLLHSHQYNDISSLSDSLSSGLDSAISSASTPPGSSSGSSGGSSGGGGGGGGGGGW